MGNIYKGDIGTKIIVSVGFDITAATVTKIYYKKPDGTTGSWTAVKEAGNTSISYTTTQVGDLNIPGTWTLQAYIEVGSWKGMGDVTEELVVYIPKATEADALTIGTNTWISLDDAEDYFRTRVGAGRIWDESVDKIAALVTAFNQLNDCGLYSFPETPTGNMTKAQCEMALFLLKHQEDMDSRLGLQAQGITQAGIVQESYNSDKIEGIPIPPMVKALLSTYEVGSPIHIIDLERDEEEDAL